MTTFGDQVFEFGGAPVGSGRFSSPWATHYFVDFDNGSASNGGLRPDDALKTIQAAVTLASGGDVIYIAPRAYQLGQGFRRYVEDITITQGGTAGSGNVDTNANLSIIGVTQRQYPSDMLGVRTKYATAAHGGWNIESPGTHIEGIGHFAEDADTYAIYFESDGATRSKGFDGASLYKVMVKGKGVRFNGGGGDMSIINCKFQCKFNGTGTPLLELIGSAGAVNRLSVIGCDFIGGNANNYATAPVTGAAPVTSFVMRDCHFSQDPDSGDFINFAGTTNSGVISNCYFGSEGLAAKLGTITSGSSGIHAAGLFDENGAVDLS
jgi:hypothetical protein